MLWIADEDAEQVKKDITTEIPGLWDAERKTMMRPTDPAQAELNDLVRPDVFVPAHSSCADAPVNSPDMCFAGDAQTTAHL